MNMLIWIVYICRRLSFFFSWWRFVKLFFVLTQRFWSIVVWILINDIYWWFLAFFIVILLDIQKNLLFFYIKLVLIYYRCILLFASQTFMLFTLWIWFLRRCVHFEFNIAFFPCCHVTTIFIQWLVQNLLFIVWKAI